MATLTREQAAELLRAYIEKQTAAADADIAAYDGKTDAALAQTEADIAAERREAKENERAAYSRAAVQALIDRYAVAQVLGSLGLSRSGAADSHREGIVLRQQTAQRRASAQKRQAVSELSRRLLSARQRADADKSQHAAAVNKTLAGKIAEKTLTLDRQTMV